eukprot:gene11583-4827_t
METQLNNFVLNTNTTTTTTTTTTTNSTSTSTDSEASDDPDNDTDNNNNSSWSVSKQNNLNWKVDIFLKTRLEKATPTIPESLYAPIVYQMSQKVTGPSVECTKFILIKYTAVNSETHEPLIKNGKDVLIGGFESGLTYNEKEKSYQGTTKIQFGANSSHFEGKEFKLKVDYFMGEDLTIPVFSMISTKFRVYARKPDKKKTHIVTSPKRKIEEVSCSSSDDESPKLKKIAVAPANSNGRQVNEFKDFAEKLEELLKYNRNLKGEQKQFCMDFAIKCFMKVDPTASKNIMMMNVTINGQLTDVLEYGCHIGQDNLEKMILIIPGNPGVVNFYDHFAKKLHFSLNIPVIVVGYLGHSFENTVYSTYSIHEQLDHKEQFIKHLIEKYPKLSIHLIGHSIGGWVCLQLLNRNIENIKQFFGLFPTISYLNLSENGQHYFYQWTVKFGIRNIFALFGYFASYLPKFLRIKIAEFIRKDDDSLLEPHVVQSLFSYQIINNIFYMAGTEFKYIGDADYNIIDKNQSKIQFYYGEPDHWVPTGFNQKMKKKYPEIVTIDKEQTKHAFVLYKKSCDKMVRYIQKLIK